MDGKNLQERVQEEQLLLNTVHELLSLSVLRQQRVAQVVNQVKNRILLHHLHVRHLLVLIEAQVQVVQDKVPEHLHLKDNLKGRKIEVRKLKVEALLQAQVTQNQRVHVQVVVVHLDLQVLHIQNQVVHHHHIIELVDN